MVVSQIYGAGRHGEVEGAVHTSMALALTGGLGMTVFGLLFAPLALQWMGTPAEVMPYAADLYPDRSARSRTLLSV